MQNETKSLKPETLWGKLMLIQKAHVGFLQTVDSAKKKDGKTEPAYCYTPGYEIVTSIRKMMDDMGIMIPSTVIETKSEPIKYNVSYKCGSQNTVFEKTEVLYTILVDYTIVDTATGEEIGPYRVSAAGANGIDKGMGSALSFAERYFLLKFFHIPTKDKDDEPEAHDCCQIPGMSAAQQAQLAAYPGSPVGYAPQQPMYAPQGYAPQGFAPQQGYQQPMYQQPTPVQAPVQAPAPAMQTQQTPETIYKNEVAHLSNFDKNTATFNRMLTDALTRLKLAGFNTADPAFQQKLVEDATYIRENNGGRQ